MAVWRGSRIEPASRKMQQNLGFWRPIGARYLRGQEAPGASSPWVPYLFTPYVVFCSARYAGDLRSPDRTFSTSHQRLCGGVGGAAKGQIPQRASAASVPTGSALIRSTVCRVRPVSRAMAAIIGAGPDRARTTSVCWARV